MHLECRFAVLELSDEFLALSGDFDALHSRLNVVRYHHGGINKSYYGGDTRSWQRYTRRKPIATNVELCDTGIRCAVQERLVFGKLYALVILHTSHDHRFVLYEDKLFPFTVAKSLQQVEAEAEAALALELEALAAPYAPPPLASLCAARPAASSGAAAPQAAQSASISRQQLLDVIRSIESEDPHYFRSERRAHARLLAAVCDRTGWKLELKRIKNIMQEYVPLPLQREQGAGDGCASEEPGFAVDAAPNNAAVGSLGGGCGAAVDAPAFAAAADAAVVAAAAAAVAAQLPKEAPRDFCCPISFAIMDGKALPRHPPFDSTHCS